jgi:hypothetical protein
VYFFALCRLCLAFDYACRMLFGEISGQFNAGRYELGCYGGCDLLGGGSGFAQGIYFALDCRALFGAQLSCQRPLKITAPTGVAQGAAVGDPVGIFVYLKRFRCPLWSAALCFGVVDQTAG